MAGLHVPLGPLRSPLGRDLWAGAMHQAAAAVGDARPPRSVPVAEDDLDHLPAPAQRFLRYMGVIGRPRPWAFSVRFVGRFKRPGQSWMPCEAWQVNAAAPVTRVFHMRIDFARVVPMVGQDVYVDGRGSMHGKVLGLVPVADGAGPEFDLGELVTYVNDALVLAPSMLLVPACTWTAVDSGSFDVAFEDRENRVTARVFVDERGAMLDFATEDRWCDLPGGLVRARWTTPFDGWTDVDGRPWLTGATATWDLPDGPLPYIEGSFVPGTLSLDPPDLLELLDRRDPGAGA